MSENPLLNSEHTLHHKQPKVTDHEGVVRPPGSLRSWQLPLEDEQPLLARIPIGNLESSSSSEVARAALDLKDQLYAHLPDIGKFRDDNPYNTGKFEGITNTGAKVFGVNEEKVNGHHKFFGVRLHVIDPGGRELYVVRNLNSPTGEMEDSAYVVDQSQLRHEQKQALKIGGFGERVHNITLFLLQSKNFDFGDPVHRNGRFYYLERTEAIRAASSVDVGWFAQRAGLDTGENEVIEAPAMPGSEVYEEIPRDD